MQGLTPASELEHADRRCDQRRRGRPIRAGCPRGRGSGSRASCGVVGRRAHRPRARRRRRRGAARAPARARSRSRGRRTATTMKTSSVARVVAPRARTATSAIAVGEQHAQPADEGDEPETAEPLAAVEREMGEPLLVGPGSPGPVTPSGGRRGGGRGRRSPVPETRLIHVSPTTVSGANAARRSAPDGAEHEHEQRVVRQDVEGAPHHGSSSLLLGRACGRSRGCAVARGCESATRSVPRSARATRT